MSRPTLSPALLLAAALLAPAVAPGQAADDKRTLRAQSVKLTLDSAHGQIDIAVNRLTYRNNAYLARGPITVSGEDFWIEAEEMTMKPGQGKNYSLDITGTPVIVHYLSSTQARSSEQQGTLRARRVMYHSSKDTIELSGNVRIRSEQSSLHAERALLNLQTRQLELLDGSSPPN